MSGDNSVRGSNTMDHAGKSWELRMFHVFVLYICQHRGSVFALTGKDGSLVCGCQL